MKKLIALAAVATCGAALAVESANIVGYANSDLTDGNVAVSAQFIPIEGEGINIQDVHINASDIYGIAIQTLDAYGREAEFFTWDDWTDPNGGYWADKNGEKANYTLRNGEGLWVQGKVGDSFQTAGQVSSSDVIAQLVDGNVLVGNAFPVPVNIQDIVVEAEDIYGVALQTLDAYGREAEFFTWDDWTDPSGGYWADKNGEKATYQLKAGEALWVQGKKGDTLRVPAPEF